MKADRRAEKDKSLLKRRAAALLLPTLLPAASFAATLEERVEALENTRQAERYHTQEEKRAEPGIRLADRISLSGLLEINASLDREKTEGEGTSHASDLIVKTAQLGLTGKINEHFAARFLFLSEQETIDEGGPAVELDEATIDYERGAWSARFGRLYVPFGEFVSHFIDDPILLDLGETRQTAALASYAHGDLLKVSLFAYSGDADRAGDSQDLETHVNDWGLSLRAVPLEHLEIGASFLSDLADSGAGWPDSATHYRRRVAGWSAFGRFSWEPVEVSVEVVGAVRRFDESDLDADGDGTGDQPVAWNAEAAYRIVPELEIAGRAEGSREFFDHPKLQVGLDVSWSAYPGITLSASYLRGLFDEDFAAGLESRDRFVFQMAAEL